MSSATTRRSSRQHSEISALAAMQASSQMLVGPEKLVSPFWQWDDARDRKATPIQAPALPGPRCQSVGSRAVGTTSRLPGFLSEGGIVELLSNLWAWVLSLVICTG